MKISKYIHPQRRYSLQIKDFFRFLGEDRSIDHCRTPKSLSCRLSAGESSTTSGQGSGTSGATTG